MPFLDRSTLTYPATNSFPGRRWLDTRNPTSADYKNFEVSDIWINRAAQNAWIMTDRTATSGTWLEMATSGTGVLTVEGDTGGPVPPDGSNNLFLIGGDGIVVDGNAGTNTLTIDAHETVPLQFDADSGSATPANNILNIVGTEGISTSGATDTITVTAGGTIPTQFTGDLGTATPAAHNLNILGGTLIQTQGSGQTVLVGATDEVASDFTTDLGIATPVNNNINLVGADGISTSASGDTVTISGGLASLVFNADTGMASPVAGVMNVVGTNAASTSGAADTLTINATSVAKWIVSPVAGEGNQTTITAALAAASAGDNIFVRDGTYTENLTLKAGVNITAFTGDELTPTVSIIGNMTATFTGECTISNIHLETNSAPFLTVSGANATSVNLQDCYLNITDNDGIVFSSSNADSSIFIYNSAGDITAPGFKIFDHTSAGNLTMELCTIENSGNSVTASTISSGYFIPRQCDFNCVFNASGTGGITSNFCSYTTPTTNTTIWTLTSSPSPRGNASNFDQFSSGTVACINVTAPSDVTVRKSDLITNGIGAITGTGTSIIDTVSLGITQFALANTTVTAGYNQFGIQRSVNQPAFFVYLASNVTNVTGDGTVYAIPFNAALTNQSSCVSLASGVFTAPYTGVYHFESSVGFNNLQAGNTNLVADFVRSDGVTFRFIDTFLTVSNIDGVESGSATVPMTQGQTMAVAFVVSGGPKGVTASGVSGSTYLTYFSGYAVC